MFGRPQTLKDFCKDVDKEIATGDHSADDIAKAEKIRGEITCGFMANFLSFGLIIFCTLLKL